MRSGPHVLVVGAGLVGLATAHAIGTLRPDVSVTVVDKEDDLAAHQSGRNSGVIHSGVYYAPGSAKARLCRRGRAMLLDLVRREDIAHDVCGKVVVAVEPDERPRLHEIARRGHANGVRARLVGRTELRRLEPAVRGVEALHVADAGIVDYVGVARSLAATVADRGGEVRLGHRVVGATTRGGQVAVASVTAGGEEVELVADVVVTCAGVHGDRLVAALTGRPSPVTIVPFRGEYHRLRPEARDLCRTLIYPVPDPRFPFLGVHLTRHVSGEVLAGPNAVLALDREGYTWADRRWADVRDVLTDPGMRVLARRHWRTGLGEVWRSLDARAFARALRRMTPDLRREDLEPATAGIRAQALHPDGTLADDFVITTSPHGVHVLNAPSPAATASLAIGEVLAQRVAERW